MANNRIFWATMGVVITTDGHIPSGSPTSSSTAFGTHDFTSETAGTGHALRGVQSMGVTTTFNLEQVFELGQLSLYENIEDVPDIEVTVERVLDGTTLTYAAASPNSFTRTDGTAIASAAGLVTGANDRCDVTCLVYADTASSAGNTDPATECYMSGLYVSSLTYTMPVDGNCTESVTLVGNAKSWRGIDTYAWMNTALGDKNFGFGDDTPAATDGVQRRQEVVLSTSKLPRDIWGVQGQAIANAWDAATGKPTVHLQNISISADLGRESINELGKKGPYHRFISFPVEVTAEFEVVSASGDLVGADPEADNLSGETILITLADGTTFDLGSKSKLTSVGYSGGDTGGGNVTVSYSYSTFNDLSIATPAITGGVL